MHTFSIFIFLIRTKSSNLRTIQEFTEKKTAFGDCIKFLLNDKTNTSDYSWIVSLVPTRRAKKNKCEI